MPIYTFPDVYAEEVTSLEGPIQAAAVGKGGLQAVTQKGPPGIPIRTRTFDAWKEIFGGYEAAARGDAAYEAKAFFAEGGFELITVRQVAYTDIDDKTTFVGGVASRTIDTDGVAATAATKTGAVGTYAMSAGDTVVVDVDDAGDATATFDAAAGYVEDTTGYPVADQDGLTITLKIDNGATQTVTFSGATTTVAGIIDQINAQIYGGYATENGGQLRIVSDKLGTGSSVEITGGTHGLTFGAATAGTGDVVDIRAVTATEVKTVIEADTTATVTVNADGSFTISSPTTGAASELDFTGGTGLTALGLSVETIVGTAAGATFNTLTLQCGYRSYTAPGVYGNLLKAKITQNPRHASAGAGSDIAADITASDTSVQVVSAQGINAGSVIKVTDGTNTEYKEVTGVRTTVVAGVVSFFVDIDGTFSNPYVTGVTTLQTQEFDIQVYEGDVLVETWPQLSMLDTADNYVETVINDENFGSKYIVATDLDAAAGLGADLPASDSAATALSGGSSEIVGLADTHWIGSSTGKTGLYAWDEINEFMPFCTPGNNNAALVHAAAAYAKDRIWMEYLTYVDTGMAGADAVAYRESILGVDSSYVSLYAGGEKVFDPAGSGSAPRRLISGLGAMMGIRARVDSLSDSGPWEAPAGQGDFGVLRSALDVATEYSNTDHGLMNDAHINVIRKFSNTSAPVVWGTRTLDASVPQKFRYIPVRRFFQFVEKSIVDSTRWAVFRNNNDNLWVRLKDRISDFLLGLLGDGAFPTTEAATAYFVKIGFADGTMDSDDVDSGKVIGQIALAPNKPGEFIIFRFSQYTAGADVTEA